MDTELKKYALDALETAKEDLCRDKYLIPVAFVVTDEETFDFNLQFEDAGQKASVYEELVKFAKENNARAIITINDAHIGDKGGPEALENYYPGKLAAEKAPEYIYLTISGPAFPTWSIALPYVHVENEIVFGTPDESLGDSLHFLQGWPTK
jgi:hypothetical protein